MKATLEIIKAAKAAAPVLASATPEAKNKALSAIADRLLTEQDFILSANREDMEQAKAALGAVMADRLLLTPERIAGMSAGIRDAVALPDPVGRVLRRVERPNGLIVEKIAVPLGVIAIIYESRPNVTSDAAALALKAGSAVVLPVDALNGVRRARRIARAENANNTRKSKEKRTEYASS